MYDLLKKYMREADELEDLDKDEDIIKSKKKRDSARLMETVGSIGGDLAKLGTLGGVAPKSSLPDHFSSQRKMADKDLAGLTASKLGKRKELLGKIDAFKQEKRDREIFDADQQHKKDTLELTRKKYEKKKEDKKKKDADKLYKESKPGPEEQKLRKVLSEEESRFNILNRNLNELESLVKTHGTVDFFGPEKGDKESKLYQMAIDFAKVVDPESVAREGEVESARKYLLGIDWTRKDTALKRLESFRKDLLARREAKHSAFKKYYGGMYTKYGDKGEEPRGEESEVTEVYKPVMTRSHKSQVMAAAKATDVGDTFEVDGKKYMVTNIGADGDKEIGEL